MEREQSAVWQPNSEPKTGANRKEKCFQWLVAFLEFYRRSLLTGWRSESIHPLTDEGGGAASDEV
ncbi:hypothetical protein MKJ03_17420, partial [Rhizobium sp. SSM4.3]